MLLSSFHKIVSFLFFVYIFQQSQVFLQSGKPAGQSPQVNGNRPKDHRKTKDHKIRCVGHSILLYLTHQFHLLALDGILQLSQANAVP